MSYKGGEVGTGSGSLWSDAEVRTLRKMWTAGATSRMIGDAIGRSRNAVLGYLHRNNLNGVGRAVPKVVRMPKPATPTTPKVKAERLPVLSVTPERQPYAGERLWSTRRGYECQFPVSGEGADTFSCCKPINEVQGYCAEHRKRMYAPMKPRIRVPRGV